MGMKYYRYEELDDHPLGGGTTYIETEDGCAIRQITVHLSRYFASNINYPHWGLRLADQCIDYDAVDEVTSIGRQEFEDVWQAHLEQHRDRWNAVKQAYSIGTPVVGSILIFYPQGVIVDLGNTVLGVANAAACRASAQPEWMYPRHKVTAVVAGYDETNQWVVLAAPRVHAE
jgi:hypothetical protein